jgi:RNA polymerase sigma factor (sigma-70 family)
MLAQTTHATLLARLADGKDTTAWHEFWLRYGDLIRSFARQRGLQNADCDDIVQDVLASLTKSMPGFAYDRSKGLFRSYLKTVTLHAIFARMRQNRGEVALEDVKTAAEAAAADQDVDSQWDSQWRQYHLRQALRTVRAEFNEADFAAFEQYAVIGRSPQQTAESLNLSIDQVYQAKSRLLRRLSEIIATQVEAEG